MQPSIYLCTNALKQAQSGNLSYAEFLDVLLEDEENTRSDNRRLRLYKSAKLPYAKGLEDFDFSFQPSLKKQEILELVTLRFLEKNPTYFLSASPE